MEDKEIWKSYDQNYLVSNQGNVWSVRNSRKLKLANDGYGYPIVTIDGKTLKVHRLVAILFLGKQDSSMTVNHKNFNKKDNRVENLEWMTVGDNNRHAFDGGIMMKGSRVHTAVLNENDVSEIKELFVEYELNDTEIGKLYNVTAETIGAIRHKRSWKDVRPELSFSSESPKRLRKLQAEDIPEIRAMHEEGFTNHAIAAVYGVHYMTIHNIIIRKAWKNY